MFALGLLSRSAGFVIKYSWPLLAAAVVYIPLQFALEEASYFFYEINKTSGNIFLLALPLLLLINALLDLFYQALIYSLAWSKLHEAPLTFKSFRDWLALSFFTFYAYILIYYLVFISGWAMLMLPMLAFMIAFPFLDIVILFEHKPLGESMRRNFALLFAMPVPAVALSLVRFVLAGWIPLVVNLSGSLKPYLDLYGNLLVLLILPVDVSFLVLYSYLTRKKTPKSFTGVPFEDIDKK